MEALLESKAAALRRARLRAVRERDRSADGQFVFGVSTGVSVNAFHTVARFASTA